MKKIITGLIIVSLTLGLGFVFPKEVHAATYSFDGGITDNEINAGTEPQNVKIPDEEGETCVTGCEITFEGLEADTDIKINNIDDFDEGVVTIDETNKKIILSDDFADVSFLEVEVTIAENTQKVMKFFGKDFVGFTIQTDDPYSKYAEFYDKVINFTNSDSREIEIFYPTTNVKIVLPKAGTTEVSGISKITSSKYKIDELNFNINPSSPSTAYNDYYRPETKMDLAITKTGETTPIDKTLVIKRKALSVEEKDGIVSATYYGLADHEYCKNDNNKCAFNATFKPHLNVQYYEGEKIIGFESFDISKGKITDGVTIDDKLALGTKFNYSGITIINEDEEIGYSNATSLEMYISAGPLSVSKDLPKLDYGVSGGFVVDRSGE